MLLIDWDGLRARKKETEKEKTIGEISWDRYNAHGKSSNVRCINYMPGMEKKYHDDWFSWFEDEYAARRNNLYITLTRYSIQWCNIISVEQKVFRKYFITLNSVNMFVLKWNFFFRVVSQCIIDSWLIKFY